MPDRDGPDISHWNPVVDWDAIPDYPLFVTKATEGSGFRSPTFNENWRQMRNQGFKYRGAYHWLRSDWTMAGQLQNFKRAIDDHGGLRVGEFVMIDWETTAGIPPVPWAHVNEFILRCEAQWPGRVAVYSSDWVPGFAQFRAAYPEYPLFYANYSMSTSASGGAAEAKKYGADVWQWTSSFPVPGIADDTVDMNDVLDWSVLDAITGQTAAPLTPAPVPPPPPPPTQGATMPARYIATPPPERPGAPWFLKFDGAVSYATNGDDGYPQIQLGADQYDLLHASVFGSPVTVNVPPVSVNIPNPLPVTVTNWPAPKPVKLTVTESP